MRRWNRTIAVRVFLYGTVESKLIHTIQELDVDFSLDEKWSDAGRAGNTTVHKWISLSRISPDAYGTVLYLDSDTFLFSDVEQLFELYRGRDLYAREEPSLQLDDTKWCALVGTHGKHPVLPFNTGVCLIRAPLRAQMSVATDALSVGRPVLPPSVGLWWSMQGRSDSDADTVKSVGP